jgi:hypothetical protein
MSSSGYVYAMSNPDYGQVVKIGMTTKDPEERAKELSGATGVLNPFCVLRSVKTPCPRLHEKMVHARLDHCRVSPNKEFFSVSEREMNDVFDELIEALNFSGWFIASSSASNARGSDQSPDGSEYFTLEELVNKRNKIVASIEKLALKKNGECPYTHRKDDGNLVFQIHVPAVLCPLYETNYRRVDLGTSNSELALSSVRKELQGAVKYLNQCISDHPSRKASVQ